MLNIVIPMAGLGSRFADAGFKTPKPLIPVHGKPMIQVVIENLTPKRDHRFIFICQNQHVEEFGLESKFEQFCKNYKIVGIDGLTEGQVCSVLKAKELINNEDHLMTANSDQYIDFSIDEYLEFMDSKSYDGLIMTMKADDPKWSYAKLNELGEVIETAEKKVISEHATVGIFNFRRGKDLVRSAEKMIAEDIRVNGEFYTCPCYNYLVEEGMKVGVFNIGEEYNGMYGIGIPSDLDFFLKNPISQRA